MGDNVTGLSPTMQTAVACLRKWFADPTNDIILIGKGYYTETPWTADSSWILKRTAEALERRGIVTVHYSDDQYMRPGIRREGFYDDAVSRLARLT